MINQKKKQCGMGYEECDVKKLIYKPLQTKGSGKDMI